MTATGGNSVGERARLIATALPSLLPCDLGGIAIFEEEARTWELVFQKHDQLLRGEDAGRTATAMEPCLLEALTTPSLLMLAPTATADAPGIPEVLLQAGIGLMCLAPMTTVSRRLGVVVIARSGTEDFSPDEQLFISTLAEHSAMAFENLHLQKTLAEFSSQLQKRHELILDAAAEGIYGLDHKGHVTFANKAATEILGWQDRDIFGRPLHEVHHHSHADGTPYPLEECPINAAIKDGEIHRVDSEVFWRSDGSSVCVEYISSPILRNGKPDGAVVVFQDISRRKEIEAQREKAYGEIKRLKDELEQERDYLRDELNVTVNFGDIIGESEALQRTLAQVEAVAATSANVLVLGESGVGKEMVARAIHMHSNRRDKPLIKVNCASIPKELFESEFFGHVRGAFTGAHKDRIGRLQLADGGTIFLDEVGEIPLDLQGKLLRALQEHEFERVGDDRTISANVRVVAATNRNLAVETEAGRFRQDLYYRLSVFPIEVPPLRQRTDDIVPLARHFLHCACKELGRGMLIMSTQHAKQLLAHSWPGNIRELKNVIERAVILSQGDRLRLDLAMPATHIEESAGPVPSEAAEFLTESEFRDAEKKNIVAALRNASWRIWGPSGAADLLGVKPTTLAYRMKVLGIKAEK
ncbi:MAG: sigma 54-interacting transcriptional regulator [Woeseiaceae bacterium]|nr:sigma 54-interacting transcriptional regulator [Woeseiaceae bacterium]